jgi:hypothetical protein
MFHLGTTPEEEVVDMDEDTKRKNLEDDSEVDLVNDESEEDDSDIEEDPDKMPDSEIEE